jgi:hypothetical protein
MRFYFFVSFFLLFLFLFLNFSTSHVLSNDQDSTSSRRAHDVTNNISSIILNYYEQYHYSSCEAPWTSPHYTLLFGNQINDTNNGGAFVVSNNNRSSSANATRFGALSRIFFNNSMRWVRGEDRAATSLVVRSKILGEDVVVTTKADPASPLLYQIDGFGLTDGDCEIEDATGAFSPQIPSAELGFRLFSGNRNANNTTNFSFFYDENQNSTSASNNNNSNNDNNSWSNRFTFNPKNVLAALCSQSVQQVQLTTFAQDGLSDTSWLFYYSADGNADPSSFEGEMSSLSERKVERSKDEPSRTGIVGNRNSIGPSRGSFSGLDHRRRIVIINGRFGSCRTEPST